MMDVASIGIMKEIRRVSDPDKAQIIWDGIKTVRAQKQIPALPRLSRYMNRNYKLDKETTQRLLDLAVEDNLIKLHKKVGTKGNKAGVEEDAYRLPTEDMLPYERHDWYCFHCHAGGEVLMCRDCHRVYHQACIKQDITDHSAGFVCNFCRAFQAIPAEYNKLERQDLNNMLMLTTARLKEKMPGSILSRAPPPPAKNPYLTSDRKATVGEDGVINSADREAFASFGEEKWRAKFLLKRHIDLDEVMVKCQTSQYRILEEFKSDIQNIVHNVVIYHGAHSNMADQARQMFRDCVYDITELTTCRDCYRYANTRGDKHWFAKPCRPFHEIVYAKQKGFPYWPAKVVGKENADGQLEVRFFGGFHQRALVEKHHIKPITTNIHTLQIKRTSAWNKASEELQRYQELYDKFKDKPEFIGSMYGDPFDGEKVSQLTSINSVEDSESDTEEEQHREPGEPGSSMPIMDPNMLSTAIPPASMMTPVSMVSRPMVSTPVNSVRQPTKLRRIEPKPLPGGGETPIAAATVAPHAAAPVVNSSQAMTMPLTFVTVPQVPQQFHIQPQHIQQQQQLQAQQLQLHHQQIQIQQSPLQQAAAQQHQQQAHAQMTHPQQTTHTSMLQSPQSIHIEITPQQQAQLLSPVQHPPATPQLQQPPPPPTPQQPQPQQPAQVQHHVSQQQPQTPQPQQQQPPQQQQTPQLTPPQQPSKKEEKRKEKHKNHHHHNHQQQQQQQQHENLMKDVKEEYDADDAVSSSSHVTRFINASVQTPNKLLRMVAEEICGQSSRKPHADRDFKEYAEKLRAEFEQEKKRAINVATRSLERDLERSRADHLSEMENLLEKHRQQVSETKKKQWCYECEAEAIYWCCWNTAYCSQDCQQTHWTREHKRNCKRNCKR